MFGVQLADVLTRCSSHPQSISVVIPLPVFRRQPGDYRKMMLTTFVVVYAES